MKRKLLILLITSLFLIGLGGNVYSSENLPIQKYFYLTDQISGEEALESIKVLTCDEFEGRLSGSEGCYLAAKWIAERMKKLGLKPGIKKENSYFQEFEMPENLIQAKNLFDSVNEAKKRKSVNVIGYLQATDENSEDSILMVAHFDHLGKHPMYKTVYRGANDNASGVSCILEIARVLSNKNFFPSLNIVFIAFSGEEQGLLGSKYYTSNPIFPINKIKAVINLDMVGAGKGVLLYGTNAFLSPYLNKYLKICAEALEIKISSDFKLAGPLSDHYPFRKLGVPFIFFFRDDPTRIGHYHSPKDTIETIDPKNLMEVSKLTLLITSSFSKSSLFIFDENSLKEKLYVHPKIVLKGEGIYFRENLISIYIENSRFITDSSHNFEYLYRINSGENTLSLDITYCKRLLLNLKVTIKADIDDNLKCDFDYDCDVDLDDLIAMSKKYGKRVKTNSYEALFDLDQNRIIDEKDLEIFSNYFGYISSLSTNCLYM